MPITLDAATNIDWMDLATTLWHLSTDTPPTKNVMHALVEPLHHANFDLWHEEDKARDQTHGAAGIADAKRNIDRINQTRNDTVEQLDRLLLDTLATDSLPDAAAPLHSETPGMILDRLSILTLKIYHTQEEIDRVNAAAGHAERNRERMKLLREQRSDLGQALDQLWSDVLGRRRRFKLYRQLKMYNDPTLNPALYRSL
jgi:hypothetical protein